MAVKWKQPTRAQLAARHESLKIITKAVRPPRHGAGFADPGGVVTLARSKENGRGRPTVKVTSRWPK